MELKKSGIGSIIVFVLIIAFSSRVTAQAYELMTIVSKGERCDIVWISQGGKVEGMKLKDEAKDYYDYNPVLKRVEAYTAEGWEIVNSTLGFTSPKNFDDAKPILYFLLRRRK